MDLTVAYDLIKYAVMAWLSGYSLGLVARIVRVSTS